MNTQNKKFKILGIVTVIGIFIKYKENIINFINPYDDENDYLNIDRNDDENLI
ncbi:hypothetical protein ACW7DJ_02430 [Mammaliicoccus sciuri]